MGFILFRKETFAEIYQNGNREHYDRKIAKKMAKRASNNQELIVMFDRLIWPLLEWEQKESLIKKLDYSALSSPEDRLIIWNATNDRAWLKTKSQGDSLEFSLQVIESLFKWRGFEEDEEIYQIGLQNAVRLCLRKGSRVSLEDLCTIYRHSKNRQVWEIIKKQTTQLENAICVVDWLQGSEAAYKHCLTLVKNPEEFSTVPMYSNSKLKKLYFNKGKEIFT